MRSPQDDDRSSLVESWASNASAWVEWTRQGHDSYRWHKTSFLPLIPSAGRLTVDVGAGEGRVSRELQAVGHRVLAIDSSFTMTQAAATHPQTRVPAVVADAAGLPTPTPGATRTRVSGRG